MNENQADQGQMSMEDMSPEQLMAALFANMVMQNTNMALMFLGKVPHPQTGQRMQDLESAQMFIDQLEMLAYKTRGNLGAEEKQLLQESLISLRMAFVEELRRNGIPVPDHLTASATPPAPEQKPEPTAATPTAATPTAPAPAPAKPAPAPAASAPVAAAQPTPPPSAPATPPAPPEEESRKRFSKKY